ncbi:hypothetical protein [Maribellus sediminis]|uniref:hypothetical protein n=1 Tax=Maribellus sediminis TaxID=2696285 RepID=UPI0014312190|nr:hypothetical protein [Maribellus sediminis]
MDGYVIQMDAWHKTIETLGDPVAKALPDNFIGQGIKDGYRYYKFLSAGLIYFYQVTNIETKEVHYEIFQTEVTGKRKEKRQMYPWEEPICDTIETFNNNGAANYRFGEILRGR